MPMETQQALFVVLDSVTLACLRENQSIIKLLETSTNGHFSMKSIFLQLSLPRRGLLENFLDLTYGK